MRLIALLGAVGSFGFLFAYVTNTCHQMNTTDNLKGVWSCVSAIIDGKPLPRETTDLLRLTLTENRYKTEKGAQVLFESTYSTDPAKLPNEIKMLGTEGDFAGKEAVGIYSLEGNLLRICYVMPGQQRPASFESAVGSKAFLVTWQRHSR
jgi:uncharacterized protein (TIGR03067 family)